MLKMLFILIFLIPLSLQKSLIQVGFYSITVLMIMNFNSFFFSESLSYGMMMDLLSYMLILLSLWISLLMLMSSEMIFYQNFYSNLFLLNNVFMCLFLFLSFSVDNIFIFYLFFESSLIPIFMMILGWGFQGERVQASIYMLFYTLLGSLPLLIMIMFVYSNFFSMSFMSLKSFKVSYGWLMYLMLLGGFFIKLPMFLVHLWLPKAHVEAPVAGSMILAGVLLKLGGYGVIKILPMLMSKNLMKINYFFILLSLVGGVFISLNCMIQSDMKLLIAYSSVGHMGIMIGGCLTMSNWGLYGSMTMMLSHGLCSSAMFFLVNIQYERFGSRNLFLVKGMLGLMPKMSLWWFMFCAMNMAAPPSMNLLSEICLMNSLISWSGGSMITLGLMSFFAAGYSLYLFSFNQHGKFTSSLYSSCEGKLHEHLILFFHWVPLNILVLNFDLVVLWI